MIKIPVSVFKNQRSGFSLIELLIGIALSAVIFVGVASVMTIFFSSSARSKQLNDVSQLKNDLQRELTTNVKWGAHIYVYTDGDGPNSVLIVDNVTYRLVENQLIKTISGDTPLTTKDVLVKSFVVTDNSATSPYASVDIKIDLEHANFTSLKDHLHFVVSQRFGSTGV